jgi:hypothetical protein
MADQGCQARKAYHWTDYLSESQSGGAETPQKHIRAKREDVLGIKEIQRINGFDRWNWT